MSQPVDLVVNVYERTYRDALTPGWFPRLADSRRFPFAKRVVLINTTDSPQHALGLAHRLIADGEISEARRVSDHLDQALVRTGLWARDLRRVPHFSDCALAAQVLPGSDHLMYWDADVTLSRSHDWVSPSPSLLTHRADVAVANPCWDPSRHVPRRAVPRVTFSSATDSPTWASSDGGRPSSDRTGGLRWSPRRIGTRWLTQLRSSHNGSTHGCGGRACSARRIVSPR